MSVRSEKTVLQRYWWISSLNLIQNIYVASGLIQINEHNNSYAYCDFSQIKRSNSNAR